jgi:hypothetical protein
MSFLKKIEQDCTFDQSSGVERIRNVSSDFFGSYDLKAATDLMPIDLQSRLFSLVFGPDKAKA